MQFLLKIHNTNSSVNTFCLYYRYLDVLLYCAGVGYSIFIKNLFPWAILSLICGVTYLVNKASCEDNLSSEASSVMGCLHILLSFMLFVIIFIS